MYVDVLILGMASNDEPIFTYRVPEGMVLQVGCLVAVPVRQKNYRGIVLTVLQDKPNIKGLKAVAQVLLPEPIVSAPGLQLAYWLADYYVCALWKVFSLFVPPPVRLKEEIVYGAVTASSARELLLPAKEREILKVLRAAGEAGLGGRAIRQKLQQPVQQELVYLTENKFIEARKVFVPQMKPQEKVVFQIKEDCPNVEQVLRGAPRQRAILQLLQNAPHSEAELKAKGTYSRTALQGLYAKNLIEICPQRVERKPLQGGVALARPSRLNEAQAQAYALLRENRTQTAGQKKWLLWGVTGSGKTEVYLQVIEDVLQDGQQVLYLVPEIALTPQLVSLLGQVFGEEVAVLHSALSAGERYDQWQKIKEGRARVVLGPRSAVFAPLTNLGLIIIDEEHEHTYKQSEPDPRYDARTVAEKLAELWGAFLLLGSATPSLQAFSRAEKGIYGLIRLKERVAQRPLPQIDLVDLKQEIRQGNRSIFSRELIASLKKIISAGEQAILFLNRRGFHTYVMCRECGQSLVCPHCRITLIYHRAQGKLICHYCHFMRTLPKNCAFCGSTYVRYYGTGTERVATEFARFFPAVPFLRMDTDTTQRKDSHLKLIKEFQEGRARVLIGTQMIAKGLDFPAVTLVGVINPDFFLNLPDYQAGERAYQLLTQVAGRAGRGAKAGRVIIQTFSPDHYLFAAVRQQDYAAFYQQEIANRRILAYPPFRYLARIMVSGYNEREVKERITAWHHLLQKESAGRGGGVEFLGPGPAPLAFLKKRFRFHLLLKGKELRLLQDLALLVRTKDALNSGEPRTIIDLEPQNLL